MTPKQIVDQSQAQKRYPVLMTHPGEQKATTSGYTRNPDGSATDDPPGVPGKYQAHWVSNLDQETYYASMGYAPQGTADIEAYRRETCGIEQPVSHDYPRALYRKRADGELDKMSGDGWKLTPDEAYGKKAAVVTLVQTTKLSLEELMAQMKALQAQIAAMNESAGQVGESAKTASDPSPDSTPALRPKRAPRSEAAKAAFAATMAARKAAKTAAPG